MDDLYDFGDSGGYGGRTWPAGAGVVEDTALTTMPAGCPPAEVRMGAVARMESLRRPGR